MNNKGFAVSGILYSILVLFLMLLLLILGNFQSRKIIFDKQKNSVLQKLENRELFVAGEFCYSDELQRFDTPSDGLYKLEIYSSNSGGYATGNIRLYQGIPLYVLVGQNGSISSIRTESNKVSTVILSYGSDGGYAYNTGSITDITLDYVEDVQYSDSMTQDVCENSGYVKISKIGD